MTDPADVRVSDQERDRAAQEIRDHFAAGRLDEDELNERVSAAYKARTAGELAVLRSDLPALPATTAETRAAHAERRRDLSRRLLQQTGAGLVTFAIATAIWIASGGSGSFWPIWILLICLIPLLRNGWRLYGPSPELDHVEQHLERRSGGPDRHQRRQERYDRRRRQRGL